MLSDIQLLLSLFHSLLSFVQLGGVRLAVIYTFMSYRYSLHVVFLSVMNYDTRIKMQCREVQTEEDNWALKAQTRDDNRGPWVINNSAVVIYRLQKECNLGSWVKQFKGNKKNMEQVSDICKKYHT